MKKLQQLSTSVKALVAIGGISVVAGGGVMLANAMETDNRINAARAKQIALQDAGVDAKEVQFEKAALEKEDGQSVYEVKFRSAQYTYDYTIASRDGDILDREVEGLKENVPSQAVSSITLEEAKKLVLQDAGVKAADGNFTKTASKQDDGLAVYEIEFQTAQKAYEYKLLAKDGTIIKKDVENNKKAGNASGVDTAVSISKADAKSKALADAKESASHVTFTKARIDYEDGQPVYEIEFISATTEYDYEIDAVKGTIIERKAEKRKIQSQEQSKPSASYIGVDKAKNTALSHAGLQEKEVLFTKAKLENDDGQSVYEIEFRKGNTEYDYTINAFKGSILEWDKDTDHDD